MATTPEREWLTVIQFKRRYDLGSNLVYNLVRQKIIRSVKLGGKILIAADAIDVLARAQAEHADATDDR